MPNVFITGANRGVGLALAKVFKSHHFRVLATARNPELADELKTIADEVFELDVLSQTSLDYLTSALDGEAIDVLINNAGIYGPKNTAMENVDLETWMTVLHTNTIGPFMLTRALLPNVKRGETKTVACVSSKVGSIADNGSGAGYMYRSSKSALNQVVKSLSIDLAKDDIKVVAVHPGWVQTDMGGPNALITPEQSAQGLHQVITGLTTEKSGGFINYNGEEIPW